MTKEVKVIFLKYLNKLLFPDFTNKLTWLVAFTGLTMIATPVEFRVAVCNWLIEALNVTSLAPFEVPTLEERNDTGWYILILSALIHNLVYKYISLKLGSLELEIKREKRALDISLYEQFISLLPTSGQTVQMLKEQDFSSNIRKSSMKSLDDFIHNWEGAEYRFNNPEIEAKKSTFLKKSNDFRYKVAQYTVPKSGGFLTVYPRHVDPEIHIPENIRNEIQEMNSLATQLYQMHQDFISYCKSDM